MIAGRGLSSRPYVSDPATVGVARIVLRTAGTDLSVACHHLSRRSSARTDRKRSRTMARGPGATQSCRPRTAQRGRRLPKRRNRRRCSVGVLSVIPFGSSAGLPDFRVCQAAHVPPSRRKDSDSRIATPTATGPRPSHAMPRTCAATKAANEPGITTARLISLGEINGSIVTWSDCPPAQRLPVHARTVMARRPTPSPRGKAVHATADRPRSSAVRDRPFVPLSQRAGPRRRSPDPWGEGPGAADESVLRRCLSTLSRARQGGAPSSTPAAQARWTACEIPVGRNIDTVRSLGRTASSPARQLHRHPCKAGACRAPAQRLAAHRLPRAAGRAACGAACQVTVQPSLHAIASSSDACRHNREPARTVSNTRVTGPGTHTTCIC